MTYTWALLVALATSVSASNCYYPDGSRATDYDYEPCGNTNYSTCCYFGEGDKCLSNGLCSNPGKYDYYRAACANKDWSNCPHACMDEDSDNWLGLTKCGENKYCCPSGGDDCCSNGAKVYTLKVSNSTDTKSGDSTESDSGSSSSSSSSSSTSQSTNTGSSGSSGVPVGPIAGGVVGGFFFIGFVVFGFVFFKRRGKKNAASTSVEAGSSTSSGSDGKGSDETKPTAQTSLAEIEGSQGKVWNETDGKPVVGVQPTYEEEQKRYYTETTPTYSQQGTAEVEGEAVRNVNPSTLVHGSTTPKQSGFETTHCPTQLVAAELDGGTIKDENTGHFTSTFDENRPEAVHSPLQQSAKETRLKDVIRPDSGTLAPDWPIPGQNGFEATQRLAQQGSSEMDGSNGDKVIAAPSSTVASTSSNPEQNESQTTNRLPQNAATEIHHGTITIPAPSSVVPTSTMTEPKESKIASRPAHQNVAEVESGAALTLDLGTFDPVFSAFEHDQTGTTSSQGVVTAAPVSTFTEQKTTEFRQSTGQQVAAEIDSGAIAESGSSLLTYSAAQSTAVIQDSTQQAVEADSSMVVEADSNVLAPASESPKERAKKSISKQQAIEADSNALSEADSTPVSLGSMSPAPHVTQMKFLPLA